jgi:hypothetical protein
MSSKSLTLVIFSFVLARFCYEFSKTVSPLKGRYLYKIIQMQKIRTQPWPEWDSNPPFQLPSDTDHCVCYRASDDWRFDVLLGICALTDESPVYIQ